MVRPSFAFENGVLPSSSGLRPTAEDGCEMPLREGAKQERQGVCVDAGTLALARSRDVQHFGAMASDPRADGARVGLASEIDHQERLPDPRRELARERRAGGDRGAVE